MEEDGRHVSSLDCHCNPEFFKTCFICGGDGCEMCQSTHTEAGSTVRGMVQTLIADEADLVAHRVIQ